MCSIFLCFVTVYYIVLESRQITVSGGRKEPAAAGAPLQYTIPLNCTVWTSCTGGYHKVNYTWVLRYVCRPVCSYVQSQQLAK